MFLSGSNPLVRLKSVCIDMYVCMYVCMCRGFVADAVTLVYRKLNVDLTRTPFFALG